MSAAYRKFLRPSKARSAAGTQAVIDAGKTATRYFINGARCNEQTARAEFAKVARHYGADDFDITANWSACQSSEESRDTLLPSHIEIIQGG